MCTAAEFRLFTLFFISPVYNNPIVSVEQGLIGGCYQSTWKGREFSAFMSIPYAQPPIGDLRFKVSKESSPWNDILDGCQPSKICPQINIYANDLTIKGDEDCLYLNVYTPKLKNFNCHEKFPVIVFIHGGGFMNGHGNADIYGPKILLDKNVVLVTIQYRLGALGFLSTGDEVVPGNNGLKDQTLALRWIKKNIDKFGGEPNKITIMGQSAGGASVHYHILSPLSRGLFSGAIAHSGNAISIWSFGTAEEARRNSQKLGEFLNCPKATSISLVNCLKNVDAYDIIAQDTKFNEWSYDPMGAFKPVIEISNDYTFLPTDPIEIMKSGDFAQVPFITGHTIADGGIKVAGIFNSSHLVKELNDEFFRISPLLFQYKYKTNNHDHLSKAIRRFYFGERDIDHTKKNELIHMFTDSWAYFPQTYSIFSQLHKSNENIYTYVFAYNGSVSLSPLFGDPDYKYGAIHGDDLIYLLSSDHIDIKKLTDADKKMINLMTTMWVNFAETGNPTPKLTRIIKQQWLPVQIETMKYFDIKNGNEPTMQMDLGLKAYTFWTSIFNSF